MYRVENLWQQHAATLDLSLVAGDAGLKRPLRAPEAHRPGLTLSGYLKGYSSKRILVFGIAEIEYLQDLHKDLRKERLEPILAEDTPCVIVARALAAPEELISSCTQKNIPLFSTKMMTSTFLSKLHYILGEAFAPSDTVHGTFVEVFGVGVLIQGESSVGKSEAALGLIERGHRLVSDDVVRIRRKEGEFLEGTGAPLTRHMMEIRGIGIINVAHLYGAVCVRENKNIDIVVRLEAWDDTEAYDRIGLDESYQNILSVPVPFHLLPVKPGRDVVLLLETIALNHRLEANGIHSAKEFDERQKCAITAKKKVYQ